MKERLQKYLARCGVSSRRKAEELILSGKVLINNQIIRKPGIKIDPGEDIVKVAGRVIKPVPQKVYYLLNKPLGFVTTAKDKFAPWKVIDLVPKKPRVFPVGRLDKDTSGLLVLTNDGDFAYRFSHPKFEKEKEYEVRCQRLNSKCQINDIIRKFKRGIKLEEGLARADKVKILGQKKDIIKIKLVIHQGWKRQIRRMCEAVELKVLSLKRTRIDNLKIGNLPSGKYRILSSEEIGKLKSNR